MAELAVAEALVVAAVALLFITAAYVASFPARGWPKRFLALFLAFVAFQAVAALLGGETLVPASRGGELGALFRVYIDANLLWSAAFLGFSWLYPARAPLRSWHGAVHAGAALVLGLGAAAWLAAPGLLWLPAPGEAYPGSLQTLLYQVTLGPGWLLALTAMLASGFSRAAALSPERRRSAELLLPSLVGFVFNVAGALAVLGLQRVAVGQPFLLPYRFEVPGDCCDAAVPLWLVHLAAPLVLAAVVWARRRAWVPAALVGIGVLLQVPVFVASAVVPYSLNLLYPALGVLYVAARHREFGASPMRGGGSALLAVTVLLLVATIVLSAILSAFPESPLATSVGVLLGFVVGSAAAFAVLPAGRGLLLEALGREPAAPEGRLGPYRVALEAELRRDGGAGAAEGLRALRAQLGISEQEHAAMLFVLRPTAAAAPGDGPLSPGGRFLDRYRVVRRLGGGGGGVTHLCRDEVVGRDVVIKAIRAPLPTPESLQQVLREARAIGAIRHPNVVALHDVLVVGPEVFIVMEHAEGGSLAARLERGRCEGPEFAAIARGVLRGLEAVHAAGVVHRDVKPSNVLLTSEGEPKLADFGVAHIRGFENTVGGTDGEGAVGTVRFMSPEQAKGRRATARSDLFSAAATLYEAFAGQPYLAARPGETPMELQMRAARAGRFEAPMAPGPLRAWFARGLAPEPERRFASAREMAAALEGALDPAPPGSEVRRGSARPR